MTRNQEQKRVSMLNAALGIACFVFAATSSLAIASEPVFFEFPEDGSSVVLELVEPMGFGVVDPETGERGSAVHHLIVHADGSMWLSKLTAKDPFGYETTQLTLSEMNELFAQVYEKSALNFDPRAARARELEEPHAGSSSDAGFFRINVVIYDPARSETKRLVRFETPIKDLRSKAKFYKDDEYLKFAESIQVLREKFFNAPKGLWQ